MLCGSLAFAVMGALAHALGASCDWQVIAIARAALPLVLAIGLAQVAGARLVIWRPGTLWVRSIAGSLSMVCMFFALTRLPVSDVFTLNNMFPIWVALLSWPVLNEPPSGQVWLSVASGVLGVVLIQQPHIAEGNFAVVAALASSFLTAVAMLGLHRLQAIDPSAIVAHFSAVALLFCTASYFAFDHSAEAPDLLAGGRLLLLLGIGLSATVGQLFLTRAFAAGPPAKVSVVGLTQVVFSMLLDRLLFGHRFQALALLGMGLVLAPTAWLMIGRPLASSREREPAEHKSP